MQDRLRFRGLNSSSCRLPAVQLLAEHPRPKPPFSPKGGFLLNILEFSFRKIKITIDIYNKIL